MLESAYGRSKKVINRSDSSCRSQNFVQTRAEKPPEPMVVASRLMEAARKMRDGTAQSPEIELKQTVHLGLQIQLRDKRTPDYRKKAMAIHTREQS